MYNNKFIDIYLTIKKFSFSFGLMIIKYKTCIICVKIQTVSIEFVQWLLIQYRNEPHTNKIMRYLFWWKIKRVLSKSVLKRWTKRSYRGWVHYADADVTTFTRISLRNWRPLRLLWKVDLISANKKINGVKTTLYEGERIVIQVYFS